MKHLLTKENKNNILLNKTTHKNKLDCLIPARAQQIFKSREVHTQKYKVKTTKNAVYYRKGSCG